MQDMTDTAGRAPDWYPDPWGRAELRYFDGSEWTANVASHGKEATDPPGGESHVPVVNRATGKVVADVAKAGAAGAAAWGGGGTLFTEAVLVVNQKAKLIEVNNEYAIYDQNGTQIGAVRQVGQSKAKKVLRVLTSVDQFMTHKLQIVDASGSPVLALTRPAKLMKSRVIVEDANGQELGQIVQENMVGKIHFGLHAAGLRGPNGQDGRKLGAINAENWRAWNFNITDESGNEVARITKTWEGLAKTMFTTADNYVLQIHRPLDEPLRSLVVAAALGVDTALKQDSRGFG